VLPDAPLAQQKRPLARLVVGVAEHVHIRLVLTAHLAVIARGQRGKRGGAAHRLASWRVASQVEARARAAVAERLADLVPAVPFLPGKLDVAADQALRLQFDDAGRLHPAERRGVVARDLGAAAAGHVENHAVDCVAPGLV
jgi:hypothetical protein